MKRTTRTLIASAKHRRMLISQTHGKYFQDASADISKARKRQADRFRENRRSMGSKSVRAGLIKAQKS